MIDIYTGLPPGLTGTGQLVRHIVSAYSDKDVSLRTSSYPLDAYWFIPSQIKSRLSSLIDEKRFRHYLSQIKKKPPSQLLILHPQSIGFNRTLKLIDVALEAATVVKVYLLDNSFFCVKSYNFLNGKECQLCIEQGGDLALKSDCRPFPNSSKEAFDFRNQFGKLVRQNKLKLYFQSESQRNLASKWFQKSFHNDTVVGMWTDDLEKGFKDLILEKSDVAGEPQVYDIVFHGSDLEPKGSLWTICLAEKLPELTFLFPFNRPDSVRSKVTTNCHFEKMTWDTGLKKQVQKARAVIVPSLWSAPIEGALIKSLMNSNQVLAVETEDGYASSISAPNLFLLPFDLNKAATDCKQLMDNKSVTNHREIWDWLTSFEKFNRSFLDRINDN